MIQFLSCALIFILSGLSAGEPQFWESIVESHWEGNNPKSNSVFRAERYFDEHGLCLAERIETRDAVSQTIWFPDKTYRKRGEGEWVRTSTDLEDFRRTYAHARGMVFVEESFLNESLSLRRSELDEARRSGDQQRLAHAKSEFEALDTFIKKVTDGEGEFELFRNRYQCAEGIIIQAEHDGGAVKRVITNSRRSRFPFDRSILEREAVEFNPPAGLAPPLTLGVRIEKVKNGWSIREVAEGFAGSASGLRVGDIMTGIDDVELTQLTSSDLSKTVAQLISAGASHIIVERSGKELKIPVKTP